MTKAEGTICRLSDYVFVHDLKATAYIRKPELRSTVIDLAESGYIVNIIGAGVNLADVTYKYERTVGLVAMDGKDFSLSINEFGIQS